MANATNLVARTSRANVGDLSWILCLAVTLAGCSPAEPVTPRRPSGPAARTVATSQPLPPIRQSAFRNTGPDATYVGNQACVDCHADEHGSYLQTTHSRALNSIDVDQQPPDAELTHDLSGRSYRIYRQEDQLRHREFLTAEDGSELVLADYPMKYVIGSGNNSRSYLLEIGGFLFESPLTWYTARDGWDLSPGYGDDPTHPGFSRTATRDCVMCHAGQVEYVDRSIHKLAIHEMTIGCERCHGPGSLHVAEREADKPLAGDFDDTIVHPSRLPRELQEAICAQCHLASKAEASVRGRSLADFRPSLRVNDFRIRYRLDTDDDEMTVVGHIEQMRASRCYQMSAEMTCTTCHHMHSSEHGAAPSLAGRASCLSCHDTEACGLTLADRHQASPDDNCITCHMPKSGTDIPHFSFHHHRIGIHAESPPQEPEAGAQPRKKFHKLLPIDDVSHLSEMDQKRCLGLAYIKTTEEGEFEHPAFNYEVAVKLLEEVRASGIQDAEVDATLARVYMRLGNNRLAADRGQSALLAPNLSDEMRRDAVGALSRIHANDREFRLAQPYLEELIQYRYIAEDHFLLSISRHRANDLPGALEAAQAAVTIEPDRPDLHEAVAVLYEMNGLDDQADWHATRARQLKRHLKVVVGEDDHTTTFTIE